MSEQANDTTVANVEQDAGTGDTDAQLEQMRQSEQGAQTQESTQDTQATEQAAADKQEQPAAQKTVPLAALHEERAARRALQQQLAEANARMAKVDQRLEKLFAPQPVQPPNPQENFVGYFDHRINEVNQRLEQTAQVEQQRRAEEAQRAQFTAVANAVNVAEAQFKAATPDFDDSVRHLNTIRARELAVLGMPEDQAQHQAQVELMQAAMQWAQEGRNPAQIAYELAKTRGYAPKAPAASAEQKIQTQQRGTAAAKTLGGGGAPNQGRLTAEALAKMSDEDFAKLTDSDFRKAMGG